MRCWQGTWRLSVSEQSLHMSHPSLYARTFLCNLFPPSDPVSSPFQWPDDFDFSTTRAINERYVAPNVAHVSEVDDEKEKTEDDHAKVSVSEVGKPRFELDDEIDPVALNKAFRFAAWSSVALVRMPPLFFRTAV